MLCVTIMRTYCLSISDKLFNIPSLIIHNITFIIVYNIYCTIFLNIRLLFSNIS